MKRNVYPTNVKSTGNNTLHNAGAPCLNSLWKALAGLFAGLAAFSPLHVPAAHAAETNSPKALIVYFSRSGNTRAVAEYIHEKIGGDILELKTTHSYPEEYRATTEQAREELDNGFRPKLANDIESVAPYDTIFIGYPTWWGTMPTALFTFLEKHNLAGKKIIPFCTHGGSGFGRGLEDIARLCPNSEIRKGLAIRGTNASRAKNEVNRWLRELGLAQ